MIRLLIVLAIFALGAAAANWSDAVEVRHDTKLCVSYRARWNGQFLVVQATHDAGWHTYSMDNKRRAEEKLAGKRSLGIDRQTEVTVDGGLQVAGPWYQSPPKDFSRPELRWFTWGFEQQALFVAKARRAGAGPARIAIRGQACADTTCKDIDVELSLPVGKADAEPVDLKPLVLVR